MEKSSRGLRIGLGDVQVRLREQPRTPCDVSSSHKSRCFSLEEKGNLRSDNDSAEVISGSMVSAAEVGTTICCE